MVHMQYIGSKAAGKSVDRSGVLSVGLRNPTDRPRRGVGRRRIDPVSDMLGWATGLILVTLVVLLSWAWVQRVRRGAKGEGEAGEPDPETLLDAVREAYFEGEVDRAEYERVRRKIRGEAGEDPSKLGGPGEVGGSGEDGSTPGDSRDQ